MNCVRAESIVDQWTVPIFLLQPPRTCVILRSRYWLLFMFQNGFPEGTKPARRKWQLTQLRAMLLFWCVVALHQSEAAIIRGRILNYDGKSSVSYQLSFEQLSLRFGFFEKAPVSSDGSFEILYPIHQLTTIRISYQRISYEFILREDSEIAFVIDQGLIVIPKADTSNSDHFDSVMNSVRKQATVHIEGDLAEANRYLNSNERTIALSFTVRGCDVSLRLSSIGSFKAAKQYIDSLLASDINTIKQLQTDKDENRNKEANRTHASIDEVKAYLQNEAKAFYYSTFLNAYMKVRLRSDRESERPKERDDFAEWKVFISAFLKNASAHVRPAPTSASYNEYVLNLKYTADQEDTVANRKSSDVMILSEMFPHPAMLDSLVFANADVLKAYRMHFLSIFLNTQYYYSSVLKSCVEMCSSEYKGSRYLEVLRPKTAELDKYLSSSAANSNEKIIILKDDYRSVNDLLKSFKGKWIFVDLWASWCGPCVEQFSYKERLNTFLEENNVSSLYISLDGIARKDRWMKNIYANDLHGFHYLPDTGMTVSIWNFIGGRNGVIPRYVLIDTKGAVSIASTSLPADLEQLSVELSKKINNR